MDDPILRAAVLFTRHHLRLIAAVTVICGLAGLAVGLYLPRRVEQHAVMLTGATYKEGPIETLEVLGLRLADMVEARAKDGRLPEGSELEARAMVGQPPPQEDTNLLELIVRTSSKEAALEIIHLVERTVIDSQLWVMREERERIGHYVVAMDSSIQVLKQQRITTESAGLYVQLVRELIDTARMASPVRAFEPKLLAVHRPIERGALRALGVPLFLGLLAGLGAGYGAAFFRAAQRR